MNEQFQIDRMQHFFETGTTRPLEFRREQLRKLSDALVDYETRLLSALHDDLRKSPVDAYASEIGYVQSEIRHTLKNLKRWAQPKRVSAPLMTMPARARVIPEPKGVVLIIGPWNYPAQLVLSPLVAAIAAGNCAVLKPSELTPNTSNILRELIEQTFAPDFIKHKEGGQQTAGALLDQPFDHIFFTGGTEIGRKVAEAAAMRLIPVTLELGGKCPVILGPDADLELAARRIARGKFMNAGQTCVAPDHVWVPRERMNEFFQCLEKSVFDFYSPDPKNTPDYGRIVSERHVERLRALWPDCICSPEDRYVAPTIIADPPLDSPLMQEEIFGPLLPILPYDDEQQVMAWCRARPVPLALYLFTNDREKQQRLMDAIPSGGVCINDTLMHIIPKGLPFGGKGESGMGAYHGKTGFDEFSHFRSVLKRSTKFDFRAAYPPIQLSLKAMKKGYRFFSGS